MRIKEILKYFYEVFSFDINFEKLYIYFGVVNKDKKVEFIELVGF